MIKVPRLDCKICGIPGEPCDCDGPDEGDEDDD